MHSSEVVHAFVVAMKAAGVEPKEAIEDRLKQGGPIYFDCAGDKPRSRKGWAVLHLDERPAGAFGHFKSGINERWKAAGATPMSQRDRDEHSLKVRNDIAAREAELLGQHEAAAAACLRRWSNAAPVNLRHPYLVKKRITGEGLRQEGNLLLVPMHDEAGRLWNLQVIWPDGTKRYSKDARLKGLCLVLGKIAGTVAIAEGYGTAAVIRRATDLPIAVAFTWSNLTPTARAMRRLFPLADIIIGADDDAHLVDHPTIQRNIGLEEAKAAARAVGGRLAVPPRKAA